MYIIKVCGGRIVMKTLCITKEEIGHQNLPILHFLNLSMKIYSTLKNSSGPTLRKLAPPHPKSPEP